MAAAGDKSSSMYQSVLDAAEMSYDRKGWSRATMDEVARIAGVSRGYIYKHFVNRDGLMLAVLVRRAEMYNERARRFIDAQPNLTEKLVEGILLGVKLARRDPYFGKLVGAATSDPEHQIAGAMQAAERSTDDLWRPILERANARGELADGVLVEDVIEWVTLLVLGLLAHRQAANTPEDVQERQLRTLFTPAVVRAHHDTAVAAG